MASLRRGDLKALESAWITPNWPVAPRVRAYVTTRAGSVNADPYGGFNTASHVGDDSSQVRQNRLDLQAYFGWKAPVRWINQTHTTVVEDIAASALETSDAVTSDRVNVPCLVHTADCLPVFFADKAGARVAVAHAGWRGLLHGVLENTLAVFSPEQEIYAWLGPAIGQDNFEVGDEVREMFVAQDAKAEGAFIPGDQGKYFCDLYYLATLRLHAHGRCCVMGGGLCTYADERFFSYRRQPITGRMLSMIWIEGR